jgi:lactobin A/cerein 7B family class IIb bacteriocin
MELAVVNLESFGLVELNAQEMQEIDGGIAPLVVYGAAWCVGFAVGCAIAYYYS